MRLILIRHGMTKGNRERRYIGQRTDEPLCEEGIRGLRERCALYPAVEKVYTSPMMRSIQTAEILYPELPRRILEELAETDFGRFEGRNAKELALDPCYQMWIDSGGALRFPGGESPEETAARAKNALEQILRECRTEQTGAAAVVTHGGPIMAIMHDFTGEPAYSFHAGNGEGYILTISGNTMTEYQKIGALQERVRSE